MNADQSLVSFSRNVQETVSLRKELAASKARIAELEAWIKAEGEHTDTCTFNILKKVCDGCRCGRLDTNAKSSQSSDEGGRGTDRGMVDGNI